MFERLVGVEPPSRVAHGARRRGHSVMKPLMRAKENESEAVRRLGGQAGRKNVTAARPPRRHGRGLCDEEIAVFKLRRQTGEGSIHEPNPSQDNHYDNRDYEEPSHDGLALVDPSADSLRRRAYRRSPSCFPHAVLGRPHFS